MPKQTIKITCDVKHLLKPEELTPLQGELKSLSEKKYQKLKASLLRHGFVFPEYVWKNGKHNYVTDGHQRLRTLEQMKQEGIEVEGGKIPIVYVKAKNKKHAMELILAAMSEYGEYSPDSLYEFISTAELDWEDVKPFSNFATVNMGKLEVGWFRDEPVELTAADLKIENAKELAKKWRVNKGKSWTITGKAQHVFTCADSSTYSKTQRDIVVTDPPYEMPAEDVMELTRLFAPRACILAGSSQAYGLGCNGWTVKFDLVWYHRTSRSMPTQVAQPSIRHNNVVMLTHEKSNLGWRRPWADYASVLTIEEKEYDMKEDGGKYAKNPKVFELMMAGFKWRKWGDPFGGTGSTLVAADRAGASMVAFELDPLSTALALERFDRSGLTVQPSKAP